MDTQSRFEASIGAVVSAFFGGQIVRFIFNDNIVNVQDVIEQASGWWQITVSRQGCPFRIELHEIQRVFAEFNN